MATFDNCHKERGLRWPVTDGKETLYRFREGYDPYVQKGKGIEFYGKPDRRANIIFAPYEPATESPDDDYNLWLARDVYWSTGTRVR